jgi:hypothetical protein
VNWENLFGKDPRSDVYIDKFHFDSLISIATFAVKLCDETTTPHFLLYDELKLGRKSISELFPRRIRRWVGKG